MAQIRQKNKHEDKISCDFDKPTEHVQSEGEILIENLFKKQTNTKTTLSEQLSKTKEFVSPQELPQLTNFKSGESSLEQFKVRSEHLTQVEDLQYYGLTSHQIELYLDSQKGDDFMKTKHKNIAKSILDEQLREISDKIEQKKLETKNVPQQNVSRLVKELGLSVKPKSNETKLFNFALSNIAKKEDNTPLHHPINCLKQIESEFFSHLDKDSVPSLAKRRKRMKKLEENEINFKSTSGINSEITSKWDVKEGEISKTVPPYSETKRSQTKTNSEIEKVYFCSRPNYYTIKNDKIVKLESNLSEDVVKPTDKEIKRLSEKEIRLIPKFANYEEGTPSKVLYIKNIARAANEEFLSLFDNYICDNEKPVVKLMTGKMKGQAFVTFTAEDQATDALKKYNGYVLKEKPIIIAYGKSNKV